MRFLPILPAMLGFGSIIALFTALRLVINSRSPINLSGAFMLLTMACSLVGYWFQLVTFDLAGMNFWQNIQIIGINFMYPAWLVFILYITGKEKWVTRYLVIGLVVITIIPISALNIPSIRSWFITPAGISTIGPFTVLKQESGWLVWFSTAVATVEGIIGSLILIYKGKQVKPGYRFQYISFLTLPIFAFIAIWAEISGLNPIAPLSVFNLSIIPLCIIISLAIYSLRVGQDLNLVKENLVDAMNSAVIVLNPNHQVVYSNPTANRLLLLPKDTRKNQYLSDIHTELNQVISRIETQPDKKEIIQIGDFVFDINITRTENWMGKLISKVILLHNVTEHDKMQQTILERSKMIGHTNGLLNGLAEINLQIQKTIDLASVYNVINEVFPDAGLSCFIALLNDRIRPIL